MFFPILVTLTGKVTNAALRYALDTTGLPDKAAADAMGVHKSRVSCWRSDKGEVPDSRARALPEPTRLNYYEYLAQDAGVLVVPHTTVQTAREWLAVLLNGQGKESGHA